MRSGQTVQDYYNEGSGPDKWWFDGIGATRIDLTGDDTFLPNLYLYDAHDVSNPDDDELLAFNFGSAGAALINYMTTPGSAYYILVENNEDWDGFYNLSINDQYQSNLSEFRASGVNIHGASVYGTGNNIFGL